MTNLHIQEVETAEQAERIAKALKGLPVYGEFYAEEKWVMLTSKKKKLSYQTLDRLMAVIVGIKLALKG